MKLIKYNDNWADEMDVEGHCLMTAEQWNEFKTIASQ